jgi:hypothetical protein
LSGESSPKRPSLGLERISISEHVRRELGLRSGSPLKGIVILVVLRNKCVSVLGIQGGCEGGNLYQGEIPTPFSKFVDPPLILTGRSGPR